MEARWIDDGLIDGEPPYCRRILRMGKDLQWRACLDLAIGMMEGRTGFRQVTTQRPASPPEEYWWWPDAPVPNPWDMRARGSTVREIAATMGRNPVTVGKMLARPRSDWWMIPEPVALRARKLIHDAIECACAAGHGQAMTTDIAAVLRKWRATGHWRRHVTGPRPKSPLNGEGYVRWSQSLGKKRSRRTTRERKNR